MSCGRLRSGCPHYSSLFLSVSGMMKNGLWVLRRYSFSVHSTAYFQSFVRYPKELEWARLRGYARRMRRLEGGWPLPPLSKTFIVSQSDIFGEPLFPNLKSLTLVNVTDDLVPLIPLFLSPGVTSIDLTFKLSFPGEEAASAVTTLPTLCPNLQAISLQSLPRDPIIITAVSEMLLVTNRNILQQLDLCSPLTEEASEVICNLPTLRKLRVDIDGPGSLPTLVLPNLTEIAIEHDHDHSWLQGFRGATLGKLTSVAFHCRSRTISNFLEAFESVALTTSIPATLSKFMFYPLTSCSWRPDYRSLLPFTQLKDLTIWFSCDYGCSSTIDDDIITDLARAMPKLEILHLGKSPCKAPTGVTTKGLAALAYYCPRLSNLCVHFQIAGLDPSGIPQVTSGGEPTIPREDCALYLDVGDIYVPRRSTYIVALTLLHIFPRLRLDIRCIGRRWEEVAYAMKVSRRRASYSSKKHSFDTPRRSVDGIPFRSHT